MKKMAKTATVYSKDFCPYCVAAKELLKEKGIEFKVIDAIENFEERDALAEKHNHRTVPMIFLDGEFVGGFSELQKLDEAGKL